MSTTIMATTTIMGTTNGETDPMSVTGGGRGLVTIEVNPVDVAVASSDGDLFA